MRPDILLLDEPFSALDFDTRLIVGDDVYKIIKKEKKSAVIITHDIEEAVSIADLVIVLSKRPTKIKKIIDIDYSVKESPVYYRKTALFQKYYQDIWEIFDHEV